ncbi:transposase [Azospirillum brasilense]|uniref:transposase n=1 Tax=Azospirillum brasilense TaxID=192 RepID=UPI003AF83240|nr:transposase [Azospirillum brasilense]
MPWRDIPARCGSRQNIYDRFIRWRRDGLFERLLERLRLHLDDQRPMGSRIPFHHTNASGF